jgi:acyl carrier protein
MSARVDRAVLMKEELLAAVAAACNVSHSDISLQTRLHEIGLDSLALTAVITRMEAYFHIGMEPDRVLSAFSVDTVGELVDCIEAAGAAHAR